MNTELSRKNRNMADLRIRSCCDFLVLLLVYCFLCIAFGTQVRDLSTSDISNIGKITSKDFLVVFFDKPEIRKLHPEFAREFAKSSRVLDSFGFELARVDCASTKQSRSECFKDQNLLVYRKDDSTQEHLPLSYLFDVDSIVANLLHLSLRAKFYDISDKEELKELLSEGKGRNNVLFCFVKGLGMKEHRYFLESVYLSKSDTLFAITTVESVPKKYGLSSDINAAVFLFHCKNVTKSKDECHFTLYKGKIDRISLLRFLQAQTLPKYVVLPSNQTTVYDSLALPLNRVFVFSKRISELEIANLEQLVHDFQGSVGVILVDVNEHENMLSSFGLSEDTDFPTAAFVPAKATKDDLTYVELYPENIAVFTEHNLRNFIKPLLEEPSTEYERIAEESSLQKLEYAEYTDAMKSSDTNYLLASDFLLVVFCLEDHQPCREFSKTLRRIIRTFDRAGEQRLSTAYVKTSRHKKKFEGKPFPVIHLHLDKSNDFIEYPGKMEYEDLMNFITDSTSIKMPVFLPPSLSDEVRIIFSKDNDDGDAAEFKEEEEEREANRSSEEPDDSLLPPEETEDDEVSAAVLNAKLTIGRSDLVPALTDKTFDVVRNENDLLVVDFFQPWDARCKAFSQAYVDAATSLGGLDVGRFAIKLARVNCFDWTDVCQKNNITVYPTIKMFRKGFGEIVYDGPLESNHLTKAVLLLQPSVPLLLTSKDEVKMFFDGNRPKIARKATDIAVLAMFNDEKGKEFKTYEAAAQSLRSKFLLACVIGQTATSLSAEYGLRLPSILVFKRNDPYQSVTIFSEAFTLQHIIDFVRRSNVPSFGELTPFNLPTYLAHKRPLLIVFKGDKEDDSIAPVVTKIAGDNSLPSAFLCWMPVYSDKDVNAEILKTYTGSTDNLPALVLLDHEKGTFYHYKGEVTKPAVLSWVKNILGGQEQLSGSLLDGEWKPLLEGYDFLKMIDEEEQEKERKRIKKQKLEEAVEEATADEEGKGSEETSSEPTEPESKTREHEDKPKANRPRRPEVKDAFRDEL